MGTIAFGLESDSDSTTGCFVSSQLSEESIRTDAIRLVPLGRWGTTEARRRETARFS